MFIQRAENREKSCVLFICFLLILESALLANCTSESSTKSLQDVDNVYEEIWYLLRKESYGFSTVFTSSTEGAYRDCDFESFENVQIPECGMALSFLGKKMVIQFHRTPTSDYIHYCYDPENNILYGNAEESVIVERFLSKYYTWIDGSGRFSVDQLGIYLSIHK